MKFQFNVGNDIGNSEQDIYVDGVLIRQPNVFSTAGQIPWTDDEIDVQKNLKNIYDNLVVSIIATAGIQTGLYHIGKYALKTDGENVTSLYLKGNNSKSDQTVSYINTLANIAARAVEKAYTEGKTPNEIEVTVDMAAALPVKQHNPKNVETMKDKFMKSTHIVSVHLGVTKKVDVKIRFDFVHILQEGTPSVFALQLDSKGNWRTSLYKEEESVDGKTNIPLFEEFAKAYGYTDIDGSYLDGKNILHLDNGDGTCDSPFTRGDAIDKDFCDGVNHGIGHAIDYAIPDLLKIAPHVFNSISRQQYSEILKSEFTNRKHKFLNEAIQAFNPHCSNQVAQIIKFASNQILNIGANEIDIIAVYGGGSIMMRKQLYDQLKVLADSNRIEVLYVPKEYAVTLNAEGLDSFVRSPIYKSLKMNGLKANKEILTATQEVATSEE